MPPALTPLPSLLRQLLRAELPPRRLGDAVHPEPPLPRPGHDERKRDDDRLLRGLRAALSAQARRMRRLLLHDGHPGNGSAQLPAVPRVLRVRGADDDSRAGQRDDGGADYWECGRGEWRRLGAEMIRLSGRGSQTRTRGSHVLLRSTSAAEIAIRT